MQIMRRVAAFMIAGTLAMTGLNYVVSRAADYVEDHPTSNGQEDR
jgi:hypothetical protein